MSWLHEHAEQLELLGRQAQLAPAVAGHVGVELDLEVLVPVSLGAFRLRPAPPQRHPAARGQLLEAQRLHHVVVRAHLQPQHAVHLVRARGHDDDGQVGGGGLAADEAAHLEAVHAGQVEVQEDEVGSRAHRVEAFLARAGHPHLEARALEVVGDRLRDVRLVLDEDHAPPSARRRRGSRLLRPHGRVGSSWWCRTSRASTRKITSSAMLVAWSAMRSRLRLTRMRERARSMVPGCAIM